METPKTNTAELQNRSRSTRRALMVAGVSLAAAMAPNVSPQNAEASLRGKDTAKQHERAKLEKLERQTERRLWRGEAVDYMPGQIGFSKIVRGADNRLRSVDRIIKNPILIHRGGAGQHFTHHERMRGTDTFGSISVDEKGKPRVELHPLDFESGLVVLDNPTSSVIGIGRVQFTETPEGTDFKTPLQIDGRLIADPAGNPEQIGLEYSSRK